MPPPRILIICDPDDRDHAEGVIDHLDALGVEGKLALTAGEALWHLEDPELRFDAVIVDGDRGLASRRELLYHFQDYHPQMRRFVLASQPAVAGFEDCKIIDKRELPAALSTALAGVIET